MKLFSFIIHYLLNALIWILGFVLAVYIIIYFVVVSLPTKQQLFIALLEKKILLLTHLTINSLQTAWHGGSPELVLNDVSFDWKKNTLKVKAKKIAMQLDIGASLLHFEWRFKKLVIDQGEVQFTTLNMNNQQGVLKPFIAILNHNGSRNQSIAMNDLMTKRVKVDFIHVTHSKLFFINPKLSTSVEIPNLLYSTMGKKVYFNFTVRSNKTSIRLAGINRFIQSDKNQKKQLFLGQASIQHLTPKTLFLLLGQQNSQWLHGYLNPMIRANTELQWQYQPNAHIQTKGFIQLNVNKENLTKGVMNGKLNDSSIKMDLSANYNHYNQKWQFWFNNKIIHDETMQSNAQSLQNHWYIAFNPYHKSKKWFIRFDNFDLSTLSIINNFLLPGDFKWQWWLEKEMVSGQIKKGIVSGALTDNHFENLELNLLFNDIAIKQLNQSSTRLAGLNGQFHYQQGKGLLQVTNNQPLTLCLPMFANCLQYEKLNGNIQLSHQKNRFEFKSDNISLNQKQSKINIGFKAHFSENQLAQHDLALQVQLTQPAQLVTQYLPTGLKVIPQEVRKWLPKATAHSKVDEVLVKYEDKNFLSHQSLNKQDDPYWSVQVHLKESDFLYSADWPVLHQATGQVMIDAKKLTAHLSQVKSLGLSSSDLTIELPFDTKAIAVNILGSVQTTGLDLKSFIQQTPLNTQFSDLFKWHLRGAIASDIQLKIPLDTQPDNKEHFVLDSKIENGTLSDPNEQLQIKNISGLLHYDNNVGVASKQLKALWNGDPVTATINTSLDKLKKPNKVYINWSGLLSNEVLNRFLSQFKIPLEGTANYKGTVVLDFDHLQLDQINLNSDLKGIKLDLPPPIGKQSMEKKRVRLVIKPQKNDFYDISGLFDDNAFALQIENSQLKSALIHFGVTQKNITDNIQSPKKPIILLTGRIPSLNVMEWLYWWKKWTTSNHKTQLHSFKAQPHQLAFLNNKTSIMIDNLLVNTLTAHSFSISNVLLNYYKVLSGYQLSAVSKQLIGKLLIPANHDDVMKINIDKLMMPDLSIIEKYLHAKHDNEEQSLFDYPIHPSDFINTSIKIKQLIFNKLAPVSVHVLLKKNNAHSALLLIDPISNGDLTLKGNMFWTQDSSGNNHTTMSIDFFGKQLKNVWQYLKTTQWIDTASFTISSKLNWDQAPWAVSIPKLNGAISLRLKQGHLNHIKNISFLKLFSFLTIPSIENRFLLDFSDLKYQTLPFDIAQADFEINKGLVNLVTPINILGSSSNIYLLGNGNLTTQQIDLKAKVVLPFTANLPVFSLFLGASAPFAALLYLADQVVGSPLDKISTFYLALKGSIDHPEVTTLHKGAAYFP